MQGVIHTFLGIPVVAASRAMRSLMETVQLVAHSPATVTVEGESGSGKEVVARALHCFSTRGDEPWVSLNCAALPDSLIDVELFGAEAGGAPDTPVSRPGMFELAEGGTLFLDEIGDLEMRTQARLLRVLDSGTYFRAGGSQPLPVRVRLIVATNQNLEEAVSAGRFRADLFHRLTQFRLSVPPLRERPEDVVPLAELFLNAAGDRFLFTEDAKRTLESYSWPGNVRELRNVVNMCTVTARSSEIRTLDLPERLQEHYAALPAHESDLKRLYQSVNSGIEELNGAGPGAAPGAMLQDMEKRLILQVLSHTGGHQERAAQLLGISRRTLSRKLKQYEAENETAGVELVEP